jgi:hypothetical protein
LIDGGLEISANEKIFPSKERLEGSHLKSKNQKIITKITEKLK